MMRQIIREPLVYPTKIRVRCLQLWISSGVRTPQHYLSNLVIYLSSWFVCENPPCCNGNLRTKHTEGLRAYVRTNMCMPALSMSTANQIMYLRPPKEDFAGEGGN